MVATDMAKYMKERRAKRRQDLQVMLGGKCARCGKTENLEFNHIVPATKAFTLSGKALDTAWTKVVAEAEKCELLCTLHHQEVTAQQWADGTIARSGGKAAVEYPHGTAGRYDTKKCRCELCKSAKALYRKGLTTMRQVVSM